MYFLFPQMNNYTPMIVQLSTQCNNAYMMCVNGFHEQHQCVFMTKINEIPNKFNTYKLIIDLQYNEWYYKVYAVIICAGLL